MDQFAQCAAASKFRPAATTAEVCPPPLAPDNWTTPRLVVRIGDLHEDSQGTSGAGRMREDLIEEGETASLNRAAGLMAAEGLQGYSRRPRQLSCPVESVAKNVLAPSFNVTELNGASATDTADIRTYDGFLYLAVELDLFAPGHWMSNPANSAYGRGSAGAVGCSVAPKARLRASASLRPGNLVHKPRLAELSAPARHRVQHESATKLQ